MYFGAARTKIVFVGSFHENPKTGSIGGTLTACRSLMESPFAAQFSVVCIDTTAPNPPHPLVWRALLAARRMIRLLWTLIFERPDCALIFATSGMSWIEKGTMAILCSTFGSGVVLAPRSMTAANAVASSQFLKRFSRAVFARCEIVMVQSKRARNCFASAVPEVDTKLQVQPNWIRLDEYLAIPSLENRSTKIKVLYLGWLVPVKGIDVLIDAVSRFQPLLDNIEFTVCGGGILEAECRRRVLELGLEQRIRFEGWVSGEAKLAALRVCDVLVLPSRNEGMPNAVAEALAAGRPVVASDVGGVADLIGSNERGILVPPENPRALAEALRQIAQDPEFRLAAGAAGRCFTGENMDVSVIWRRIADMVHEAAQKDRLHVLRPSRRTREDTEQNR